MNINKYVFVKKSDGRLRVITDCRPVDARMRDPPKTDLAGGGAIGDIWVDPGADGLEGRQCVYSTKADKKAFLNENKW